MGIPKREWFEGDIEHAPDTMVKVTRQEEGCDSATFYEQTGRVLRCEHYLPSKTASGIQYEVEFADGRRGWLDHDEVTPVKHQPHLPPIGKESDEE